MCDLKMDLCWDMSEEGWGAAEGGSSGLCGQWGPPGVEQVVIGCSSLSKEQWSGGEAQKPVLWPPEVEEEAAGEPSFKVILKVQQKRALVFPVCLCQWARVCLMAGSVSLLLLLWTLAAGASLRSPLSASQI